MERVITLIAAVFAIVTVTVSASAIDDVVEHHATVRRHTDHRHHLNTNHDKSATTISAHGQMLKMADEDDHVTGVHDGEVKQHAQRHMSKATTQLMRNADEDVAEHNVATTGKDSFWSADQGTHIGHIVSTHMKPHSVWSVALLAKHLLHPSAHHGHGHHHRHHHRHQAKSESSEAADDFPSDQGKAHIDVQYADAPMAAKVHHGHRVKSKNAEDDKDSETAGADDDQPRQAKTSAEAYTDDDHLNNQLAPTDEGVQPTADDQPGFKPRSKYPSPADITDDMTNEDHPTSLNSNLAIWRIGFIVILAFVVAGSHHAAGKMNVELQPADDLAQARGRPCWTCCFATSAILLSLVTFGVTMLVLTTSNRANLQIKDHKDFVMNPEGEIVRAGNTGERAFEAGQGVALSVAILGLIILNRRYADNVQISSSLLSQFAVRGATVSVAIAALGEIVGIVVLHRITGLPARELLPQPGKFHLGPSSIGVVLTMMMVAAVEEFAKAFAVIWGTWLSAGALRLAAPSCCQEYCRLLVESPHALMLAGLAAGCGFMTIENVGYLVSTSVMHDPIGSAFVDKIVRWAIMVARVGLNIHPWMTGITMARVARLTNGRDSPSLSPREFAWALYPAVLAHGAFDLSLITLGVLAIFAPAVAWFVARDAFDKEWKAAGSSIPDSDPSEEPIEPQAS